MELERQQKRAAFYESLGTSVVQPGLSKASRKKVSLPPPTVTIRNRLDFQRNFHQYITRVQQLTQLQKTEFYSNIDVVSIVLPIIKSKYTEVPSTLYFKMFVSNDSSVTHNWALAKLSKGATSPSSLPGIDILSIYTAKPDNRTTLKICIKSIKSEQAMVAFFHPITSNSRYHLVTRTSTFGNVWLPWHYVFIKSKGFAFCY